MLAQVGILPDQAGHLWSGFPHAAPRDPIDAGPEAEDPHEIGPALLLRHRGPGCLPGI